MNRRVMLNNINEEYALFTRRLVVMAVLILIAATALCARLVYLQILQHPLYITLSDKNQLTLVPIEPSRGLIYDRNGILLADNVTVYSLEIIPERVKNLDEMLKTLNTLIPIQPSDIKAFKRQLKQLRRFESVPLRVRLTEEEVARFALNQYRFPGVVIRARLSRHYPLGKSMSHAIGYVGRINQEELKSLNKSNYSASQYIGKTGVEKYYESTLHGTVGYQQVETDANGRMVRILRKIPAIAGNNLYLTIDSQLQHVVEKAFGAETGALVAINPQNGEVLALVSSPGFDPNLFVNGIDHATYQALQNAPDRPLFNRASRGTYPQASTIKPFMGFAILGAGIDAKDSVSDPGWFRLPGSSHVYRDWRKGGHGRVNLNRAIVVSCDTYFYTFGRRIGISTIAEILKDFGFGAPTQIEIPDEARGLVPTPAWKRRVVGTSWYPGDTVITSIGQGFNLATPIQLTHATAILANEGHAYKPHLLRMQQSENGVMLPYEPQPLPKIYYPEEHWTLVKSAMRAVIEGGEGTARGRFGPGAPYQPAGKTGTAQVVRKKSDRDVQTQLPRHFRNHSLFIAFAPVDKPQIAVGVIVEHNTRGYAVNLARYVMDYFFLKKEPTLNKPETQDTYLSDVTD